MVAILPFMIYQLAGFGTLHFVVSKSVNWAINIGILCLIIAGYVANREGAYHLERLFTGLLVVGEHGHLGDQVAGHEQRHEIAADANCLRCPRSAEGREIVIRKAELDYLNQQPAPPGHGLFLTEPPI